MTEETPEQIDPAKLARGWLYKLESFTRVKDFVQAGALFHKNCVYYGLEDDRRVADWSESWKSMRKLSIDMAAAKIISAGDLIMAAAPWVATSVIEGAPFKQGRLTVGLMMFSNNKLLCVHYHCSRQPQQQ